MTWAALTQLPGVTFRTECGFPKEITPGTAEPALPPACLASGLQGCLVSPRGRSQFLANNLYLAARLLLVLLLG